MESSSPHKQTQLDIPKDHQGLYHDTINSLLYYIHQGVLYYKHSATPQSSPVRINLNSLSAPKSPPNIEPQIPKFVNDSSNDLMISPNGFYLINGSQKQETVLTNVAYSKGTHFWEFYCPLSLYGLGLGVGQKDGDKYITKLFNFTASTHRSIYMKLDVEQNKLFAWVNKQKLQVIDLPAGVSEDNSWSPCVSIKGKGNVVIFNPYSTDPEQRVSIYNPFNSSLTPQRVPTIEDTQPKSYQTLPGLKLQKINDNQIMLYNNECFRVISRCITTNRFHFDWFQVPQSQSSPIEIHFSRQQITILNQYLKSHGFAQLTSSRVSDQNTLVLQSSLKNWFQYFRFLIIHFDSTKAHFQLYQILLSKLQKIRPYLSILNQTIQPLLYSQYNILSQWRNQNAENHFETPQYQFYVSLTTFTNYLQPTTPKLKNFNVSFCDQYLLLYTCSQVQVYNIEVQPVLVFKSDILNFFKSSPSNESIVDSEENQGLQIYKILNKCIGSTNQVALVSRKVQPNLRMLATLVNMFKYPQQIAKSALIKVKNSSVDDALAIIELSKSNNNQTQKIKSDSEQLLEGGTSKIISISIAQSTISLSPILISIQTESWIKVYQLGFNKDYLQKITFKEQKGFVSFINFQFLRYLEELSQKDIIYKNLLFGHPSDKFLKIKKSFTITLKETIKDQKLLTSNGISQLLILTNQNNIQRCEIDLRSTNSTLTSSSQIVPTVPNPSLQEYVAIANDSAASRHLQLKLELSNYHTTQSQPQILQNKPQNESYIPLIVQRGPPGCNMNYPICSILYPSQKFLANYPYTIVFKHLHDKFMKVSTVVIDRIGKRKGVEIKQGLVWLSNSLNRSKAEHNQTYKFTFGVDQKRIALRIDQAQYKKYLFIMPIYDQQKNVNLPFEIGFLGVTGQSSEYSSFHTNTHEMISSGEIQKIIKLTQNGKRVDIPAQNLRIQQERYLTLTIPFPSTQNTQIDVIKPWILTSKKQIICQKKQKKYEPKQFEELISMLDNHNWKISNSTAKLLLDSDILKLGEDETFKILLNLENLSISSESKALIFNKLVTGPHNLKIKEYFSKILEQADVRPVTNINTLNLILSSKVYANSIIEPLVNRVLDRVKTSYNPQYKQLRQSGNHHLLYEPSFYSDYYFNLIEKKNSNQCSKIFNNKPLITNFVLFKERLIRTMIIDLKYQCSVNYLLLCFEKSDLRSKMRIRIYDQNKKLVSGNFYQESTWIQLTKNPFTKEMKELFDNPIKYGLNCLGIKLDLITRYLFVEISHTVLPIIGQVSEVQNLPQTDIIPEVFGQIESKKSQDLQVSKYFETEPFSTHEISNVNLNGISEYTRFSVSTEKFDYHIYRNVENIWSQTTSEDIKARYQSKLDAKDYDGCSLLLKQMLKKTSSDAINLDYLYTLLIKLYELNPTLSKQTQNKIFNQLVLNEEGPIQVESVRLLLKQGEFYQKSLSLLNDQLVKVFSDEKLKQKEVRSYIKNSLSKQQPPLKAVQLLIQLLCSNPDVKIEEWLQQIIILSQKTHQHKECFKLLEKANWIDNTQAKKYLRFLASRQVQLYKQLLSKLNTSDLVRFVIEEINNNQKIAITTLEIIESGLPQLQDKKLVHHLQKSILGCIHKSSFQQQLFRILQKLIQNSDSDQNISTVEYLLKSNSYIQLSHSSIIQKVLEKHPEEVQHLLVNKLIQSHLAFSDTNKFYVSILSPKDTKLNESSLQKMINLCGQYLIKECNYGGLEGVQCITQSELSKFSWANSILLLVVNSQNTSGFSNIKNIDTLTSIIAWILLNNTNELTYINHAYRTSGFTILSKIQERITFILENITEIRVQIVKKIIEVMDKLNQQIKTSHHLLQSTKHILSHRLHKGSIQLIELLLKNNYKIYSEIIGSETLTQIIQELKHETVQSKATTELQLQTDLANKLVFDKDGDIKIDVKNWGAYAGGNSKSSLFNISAASSQFILNSTSTIYCQKIVLGFLCIDNSDKSNIFPNNVDCYIGQNKDKLAYIGTLEMVDDLFFANYNTRVFALNLNRLKHQAGSGCIRNIRNKGFKCIKFKINKPNLVSLSDILETGQKSSTYLNYSISFLTMTGYEEPKVNPSVSDVYIKLLSMLSYPEFKESLNQLLGKDAFKKQLNQFLIVLNKWLNVPEYKKQIANLLVAIGEQSEELGNTLINSLLRETQKNEFAPILIGQMIIKAPALASSRIEKFHHYILQLINENFGFCQLKSPIEVYLLALQLTNYNLEKHNKPELVLPLQEKDIQSMLRLYSDLAKDQKYIIIELLNSLLLLKGKISINRQTALHTIQKVWNLKHKADFYPLIAPFATVHNEVSNWMLSTGNLKLVIKDLLQGLDNNQEVLNQIIFISTLSSNLKINEEINKNTWQITIFKSLSDTSNLQTLLKNVGKEALGYFVQLFKNTCIDTSAETQFTFMLKQILTQLPVKYSTEFIYDFFMPLINSYKAIPIILQPFSRDEQLYLQKPNKVLQKQPLKINTHRDTVSNRFVNNEVRSIIRKIGGFWIPAEYEDFPSSAKVLYIESEIPVKTVLIYVDGQHVTVLDGTIHHTSRLSEPIKISPDIQFKFVKNSNGLIFQYTGFKDKPKFQSYKVFKNSNDLLINELLLSISQPTIMHRKYQVQYSLLKYTTQQPLYHIPSEFTLNNLVSEINLSGLTVSSENIQKFRFRSLLENDEIQSTLELKNLRKDDSVITKLEYNAEELFEQTSIAGIVAQDQQEKIPVVTSVGLFRSFDKQGGVAKIIQVVIQSISNWKNTDQATRWLQYTQQLKSFSSFPIFFSLYMQNKENVQLLFNLLAALPDNEDAKKWEDKEKQSVRFLYKILAQVLTVDNSAKTREFAVENKFFQTMLQRLHLISKEPKRSVAEQQSQQELPEAPTNQKKSSELEIKKPNKKKGIGYGNQSSSYQKWDIEQQELMKKQTAQQIMNIMHIIINFLDTKNWIPPKEIVQSIYASSLLPILEVALRGGSLLEISKTADSFKQYLKLIRVISKIPTLVPVLMDIPKQYVPKQTQSLHTLLKQLEGTNKIFLTVANNSTENKSSVDLARDIIDTYQIVNKAVQNLNNNQQSQNRKILEKPLPQKYRLLLQDLRFDYINMRDNNGKFKHHYESNYKKNTTPPMTKMIRLAQEVADASTALPIQHTNSIFIRCDKERVDFMQALIMGPNGTPYGHGAFLFDIYFQDGYPSSPPKVNLTTTGNGRVRFNPNLYNCGKVCLSLLGTWRGQASQNWDAKHSTLLQVLISIQSIIMAQDVYFNQPGFENEQGTQEGQKKNQAYANIVRLCNIKFAMIDNLKNPPKGFESIIKRHFYLKKEQILEEVQKWVRLASKKEASYTSLVSDHNNSWCTEFKKSKTKYKQLLEEAILELETELNKLTAPSSSDLIKQQEEEKVREKTDKKVREQLKNIDIDVSYNQKIQEKQLNIEDEKVKDRWSRYIGAMGIDAVSRQSKANVLVFGLGPSALEVVKNLVLSGCKKLSIVDNKQVEWTDLSGQFFLTSEDVGKQRIDRCLHKIQQLNYYVKVEKFELKIQNELNKLKDFQLVIATELSQKQQISINSFCHSSAIPFISLDVYGPHARLFNDFGESFEVLDKNGEDPVQVIIESITNEQNGVVTVLKGTRHPYEDGDVITITKVEGMKEKVGDETINGTTHKIKVLNARQFKIGDTTKYSEYIRSGIAKNIKLPVQISFKSMDEVLKTKAQNIPIDQNVAYYDFTKLANNQLIHHSMIALAKFQEQLKRLPEPWCYKDSEKMVELYKLEDTADFTPQKEKFIRKFSFTCSGTFPPLCAFMGGYVAQQAIKAITKKYMPTNALFYCDFNNIIQDLPEELAEWESQITKKSYKPRKQRSEGLRIVIGDELLKEIEDCRVFMIGSGAIGCELLKNYAMLELGTGKEEGERKGGRIHLTDPDHIEVSNLNRQFLFRQKHLRKPKSATASASVVQMNERLKGHIYFRLDRVSDATKDIFSDQFFQSMTIVTNALDNVQARRYVDQRCLENKVPLLESGTLGPKGHVQVIVPGFTQTYGSKQDPAEQGEIPHCTLKMFPEQALHCVEWSRDKFGHKFTMKPKALQKIIESKGQYNPDASQIQSLRQSLKLINNKPDNFTDCVHYAISKFYKYYRNDIKQLLYTYPLDAKTKDGNPFWKLPKRPPTPIEKFDPKDILHCTFVTSLAVMVAKIYNIPFPEDFRKDSRRLQVGEEATQFSIPEFVPSDKKAQEISQEVSKQNQKGDEKIQEEEQKEKDNLNELELVKKIQEGIVKREISITPQQFDKDEDHRGHIDLIYSMSSLRSLNYGIEPMDWITTKLKAGKIVPALVTTTTSIAALQTYQLVKYLKKVKVADMRNCFLNLAVPIIQLSEPGEVEKVKIHENLTTNIWDRWDLKVTNETTLEQVFSKLQSEYDLVAKDLIVGAVPVYMSAVMGLQSKKTERQALLSTPIKNIVKQAEGYVDITVTFTLKEGGDLIKQIPKIRLQFV